MGDAGVCIRGEDTTVEWADSHDGATDRRMEEEAANRCNIAEGRGGLA